MNPNFPENKRPKNRGWITYILSLTLASPLQITLRGPCEAGDVSIKWYANSQTITVYGKNKAEVVEKLKSAAFI